MKDVINAKHPLRNKIFSYYNSMVQSVQNHATIPSFCNKSSGSAKTIELEWNGSKYTTTLTDSNNVLSKYNFKASISGVSFSVNGNKLTVSMDTAPSKEFTITATKKNAVRRGVVVWSEGKHGQNSSVQDVVSYAQEVSDSINGYVKMKVSYGSCQIVKTSEDGKVDGINFTITGNGINQTVTTANGGKFQIDKCRASVSVNSEIMKTNIFIGNVIIRNSEWGNKFVENLSKDMKMRFPSAKGYSVRNLKYMKKFAQIFTEDDVDEYGLGRITWSHHQILMSKVSNREEYIWYLEKTLEHKWSVDDLTSQVKSQLYERQAVANKISNFERRLPAEQKDMVVSTMKDPYMFDFINYTEEMLETDIENELVKNVTSLLMELGTGFAFMGQQYHLEVGGKDFYIDLLFYNTKLRCYVAIDLKTGEFKPEQAGKMNFYLSALDDLVKAPEDNPSVGLILCRDENRTIAEYALRDMSKPIGVSEYHLCTDLPLDLKNALPAVEDIRSRIDMKK